MNEIAADLLGEQLVASTTVVSYPLRVVSTRDIELITKYVVESSKFSSLRYIRVVSFSANFPLTSTASIFSIVFVKEIALT